MRKLGVKKYKKYQETDINLKFKPLDINNFAAVQDQISNQTQQIQITQGAQEFKSQQFKDLEELNDWDFKDKYDTSKHAVKMSINPEYASGFQDRGDIGGGTVKSYYDQFKGNDPNLQWITGASNQTNASPEQKQKTQDYHSTVIGTAIPIPLINSMKVTSTGAKLPGLLDDLILGPVKAFQNTKALKTELKGYNNDKLFNSIATNPNGQLSNKQINILAKNENLANMTVKTAIKNNEAVTAYRAADVNAALNNSTAVKGMLKSNINIKNPKEVADWLTTRVHTGGESGVGYRAGGGGSETFKFGDFAYTLPRKDLITRNVVNGANNHGVIFNTGQTAVNSQAMTYGPWVNKLKIKGTDHLTDFSSGGRKDWISKLNDYEPMKVNINRWPRSEVSNLITESGQTINPMEEFFTIDKRGTFNVPVLREGGPSNMFFGGRGQQIFEGTGSKFMPNRIGTGPKSIHKEGGYIQSDNMRIKANKYKVYQSPSNDEQIYNAGLLPEVEVSALTDKTYNTLSNPQKQVYDTFVNPDGSIAQTVNIGKHNNTTWNDYETEMGRTMHWKGALQMTEDVGVNNINNKPYKNMLGTTHYPIRNEKGDFRAHMKTGNREIYIPPYDATNSENGWMDNHMEHRREDGIGMWDFERILGGDSGLTPEEQESIKQQYINSPSAEKDLELYEKTFRGINLGEGREAYFGNLIAEYAHLPEYDNKSLLNRPITNLKRAYRGIKEGKYPDSSNYTDPHDFEYKTHTGPNSYEEKLRSKYEL